MKPIFIIGIAGRSGTHYLKQLLKKHPDIENNILKREDHFISELNYLELYVKNISYYWKRKDKEHEDKIKKNLKIGLGKGIINFANANNDKKYFLLNTPYTHNINLFPEYFPNQKMIIITRNAKDLVESGVRSKFWNYEEGFELWNKSANRIIEFQKATSYSIRIVKYEDLFLETENQLKNIFEYLELESNVFAFESIKNMTVQGSSDAKSDKNNWEYKNINKTHGFKPLSRSEKWGTLRKWRFNWKCGKNSLLLNYEDEKIKSHPLYFALNLFLDIILSFFKLKLYFKNRIIKHRVKKYYNNENYKK